LNTITSLAEIELMQRIFEGDIKALETLYDKYESLLYTFARKILKDDKQAENILEETFHLVKKKINYFDFNTKNSYVWLINLVKNKAVYETRKKSYAEKQQQTDTENDYLIPRMSHLTEPLDLDKAMELKPKIEAALNKLTDAQQYVIYLAFYEGLTSEEIASQLKIPVSTVKTKIQTALINLNENLTGKPSVFSIRNESVEMIYPYVLGCLSIEEHLKTFSRFKSSEPFPWKTLGEYQNLVSLLPVILDAEKPPLGLKQKVFSSFSKTKEDSTIRNYSEEKSSFEPVTPLSSRLKVNDSDQVEDNVLSRYSRVESLSSKIGQEEEVKEFEPVTSSGPRGKETDKLSEHEERFIESYAEKTPDEVVLPRDDFEKKKNRSNILIIALILAYLASAVLAYLFYKDKILNYETQIKDLNSKLEIITKENESRPEIPGLAELRNPVTINLENIGEFFSGSGRIIFSYEDKRGYLNVVNLPVLDSEDAYQLWGKFDRDFISLGVFKVSDHPDYYPFIIPESVSQGPVEFYIIESGAEGSRKPGSKVYMKGKAD